MNRSGKRDEKEKKPLREKLIWQKEKRDRDKDRETERQRENEGSIWAEHELISWWLVVVASNGDDWCGGGGLWRSNEGSVRREIWVKEKK